MKGFFPIQMLQEATVSRFDAMCDCKLLQWTAMNSNGLKWIEMDCIGMDCKCTFDGLFHAGQTERDGVRALLCDPAYFLSTCWTAWIPCYGVGRFDMLRHSRPVFRAFRDRSLPNAQRPNIRRPNVGLFSSAHSNCKQVCGFLELVNFSRDEERLIVLANYTNNSELWSEEPLKSFRGASEEPPRSVRIAFE